MSPQKHLLFHKTLEAGRSALAMKYSQKLRLASRDFVGVDWGVKQLGTHSCGAVMANPKALREAHQQRRTKVSSYQIR
jgi:hypothetical protein